MARNSLIAFGQSRLDETKRALHDAIDDFRVSDEKVLELRNETRRAFEELKELDLKAANRSFFGFLKFW